MTKPLTCEQRIERELHREIKTLRALWRYYQKGKPHPEYGEFIHHGLGFDFVAAETFQDQDEGYFRYQISWGGPSDEFRFYTDALKHPHRIEYRFMDWDDGAGRELTGEGKKLLLKIWDYFSDGGCVEKALRDAE